MAEPRTEKQEVDVFGTANPFSIVNLVSPEFRSAIDKVPAELLEMAERDLRTRVRPTTVDERLRLSFWNEYEWALSNKQVQIDTSRVYSTVCTKQYFYHQILHNPRKVAWIISPPVNYMLACQESLLAGIERVREILELPLVDKKGNPNTRLAEVMLKAVAYLDIRVKGAVVQRIEQKNMNVHTSLPASALSLTDERLIDKEIELIEREIASRREKFTNAVSRSAGPLQDIVITNPEHEAMGRGSK